MKDQPSVNIPSVSRYNYVISLNEVFFLTILNFRLNSKRVPDNLEKPLGDMLSHQILSRQTDIMIDEKHQNFSQQNI